MATVIFTLKEHGQDNQVYRPTQKTVDRVFAETDEYGDSRFTALLDLACSHWYGAHASLFRDKGLWRDGIYGQIVKPLSEKLGGGLNCITGRVFIELTVNGRDVCNGYDLQDALKEDGNA